MAPEARDGERLILSCSMEACGEEIVGKFFRLGKDIDIFTDLEIDPTATCKFMEVVFVDEFIRDAGESDTCILPTI